MENDKKLVRLTEEDIHMLVEDAIKEYMIQEGIWDTIKGGGQALGQLAGRGLQKMGGNAMNAASGAYNAAANRIGQAYNAAANKVGQVYDNAKQTTSNVVNTVKAGAANANVQSAKNNAIKALNNFLMQAQKTPGVVGQRTIQAVQNCIRQLNSAGGRSSANFSSWKNQTVGA